MMPSRSGSKGDAFEREVVDRLNTLYETKEFARTPGSGSLMGLRNFHRRQGLEQTTQRTLGSDLITPEWFPYSIECKWYKDSPNHAAMIAGNETTLDGWLGEALYDAKNFSLIPILFFKTNRKGTFVALPYKLIDSIRHRLTHYLVYQEFIIINDTYLNQIRTDLLDFPKDTSLRTEIRTWLEQSSYVDALINNMLSSKN